MHSVCSLRLALVVFGLAISLLGGALPTANGAEPKRILFVDSFTPGTSPFAPFNTAFRELMLRAWPAQVAFYEVSLDGWRPGVKENEDALVQLMRSRFSDLRMDLVVARGARAGQFYVKYRDDLFPDVPLLMTGDEASSPAAKLRTGDAFVASSAPALQIVSSLLQLLPDTSTIVVIMGNSPLEKYWVDRLKKEFAPLADRVDFVFLDHLSLPQMRARVATLQAGTAVLFGLLIVDAAGIPYLENYALSELRAVANVPIFSFYEHELGLGTVGGSLLANTTGATIAARVASRILRGEWTSEDRMTRVPDTPPRFDWRELARFRIDEAKLPAGSEVLFRPPSIWEEHKQIVAAGLLVLVIQAGLIMALLAQRARRRHAEVESNTLSGRLLTVHEDERRRLARELHDDVTQRLARLAIDAARMEAPRMAASAGDDPRQPSVHEGIVRLSEDVHALSYRLHPSILDDLGLEEALKAECEHVSRQGGMPIDVDVQRIPSKLPQDVALCLFRIAQEALRNVVRHGKAAAAAVTLASKDGGLALSISDDGQGFDVDAARTRPSLGHASMEERIRLLRGRLNIRSTPGHGTVVSAWVPLTSVAGVSSS